MKSRLALGLVSALVLLGSMIAAGCASVEPWQRGRLANPCMVFDANANQLAFDTHWQTAREAAAGGFGV